MKSSNNKGFSLTEGATHVDMLPVHAKCDCTLSKGTHVDMPQRQAKFGFTLAEVLITMGVIGVVAALTIPSLSSSYQKRVLTTQLQKAYSEISQAGAMVMADEMGSIFVHTKAVKNGNFIGDFLKINREITPSLASGLHLVGNRLDSDGKKCGVMKSGAIFCMNSSGSAELDTNGSKGPNLYGKDVFSILFNSDGSIDDGASGLEYIIDHDWDIGN